MRSRDPPGHGLCDWGSWRVAGPGPDLPGGAVRRGRAQAHARGGPLSMLRGPAAELEGPAPHFPRLCLRAPACVHLLPLTAGFIHTSSWLRTFAGAIPSAENTLLFHLTYLQTLLRPQCPHHLLREALPDPLGPVQFPCETLRSPSGFHNAARHYDVMSNVFLPCRLQRHRNRKQLIFSATTSAVPSGASGV